MDATAAVVFARTLQNLHAAPTAAQVRRIALDGLKHLRHLPGAGTRRDQADMPTLAELLRKCRASRLKELRAGARSKAASAEFAALHAAGLTRRECEVLGWVAHGKRDAEIATILGISRKTVGKHLENLFAKLHVETRTAAVSAARRLEAKGSRA